MVSSVAVCAWSTTPKLHGRPASVGSLRLASNTRTKFLTNNVIAYTYQTIFRHHIVIITLLSATYVAMQYV